MYAAAIFTKIVLQCNATSLRLFPHCLLYRTANTLIVLARLMNKWAENEKSREEGNVIHKTFGSTFGVWEDMNRKYLDYILGLKLFLIINL